MKKSIKQNGITLIALVITVIVLLILASISIAMLTGDNGILTQAQNAKKDTQRADVIKQAQTDILAVQVNNDGDISKDQLIEILGKYFIIPDTLPDDLKTLTLTTKAEYGNHKVAVTEIFGEGSSKETQNYNPETLKIGTEQEAKNTEKYGWKVGNYTVKTEEFTTGVWRLFFQDSQYAYLITDECVGSYIPGDYYSKDVNKYGNGSLVSKEGQKLNSKISELFVSTNTNPNIQATAWLTDTSKDGPWAKYKNNDAVFAIGSPTIELFAASYNYRSNKTTNLINPTFTSGSYGYGHNTQVSWLQTGDNHGIYNKSTSLFWWLASPNDANRSYGLSVIGPPGYFAYSDVSNTSRTVRPIVCIPTSVFDDKYADLLVNE